MTGHEKAFSEPNLAGASIDGSDLSLGAGAGLEIPRDKYGRPYAVTVDNEHRAKRFRFFSFAYPHQRSFWVSTFAFFSSFLATFAPAALMIVIREDLVVTGNDVNNSAIASVCAAVASRIVLGTLCDHFGPRLSYAILMLCCAVPTYGFALIQTATQLIVARFFIGLALAAFVTNQVWSSLMFSTNIIGMCNGLSAGIGNSGGGFTNLIMPEVFRSISKHRPPFEAWRWAMFFPGALMTTAGVLVRILQ